MKKITAIIAGVPLNVDIINMTRKCISSFRPLVDKVIFIQNGTFLSTFHSYNLGDKVDIFIRNQSNRLHAGAVNQGALLAQEDEYLAFINDDISPAQLTREQMEDMCQSGRMISPQLTVNGSPQNQSYGAHASFFIVDKPTFMKIGFWRLDLKHESDVDFFDRAESLGILMECRENYKVIHDHPGTTIHKITPPEYGRYEV